MTKIETFNEKKRMLARFDDWAGLIGKEYLGGTCGKGGQYGSVHSASGSLTIYHQAYDGANNYHDMPVELKPFLAVAMVFQSRDLVRAMREQLVKEMQVAAEAAKAEALSVLGLVGEAAS